MWRLHMVRCSADTRSYRAKVLGFDCEWKWWHDSEKNKDIADPVALLQLSDKSNILLLHINFMEGASQPIAQRRHSDTVSQSFLRS
jgi:hypothetical protein